jgi:hypothetical protein
VVIAVMTQVGFSGNNRYLVLGSAMVDICGAIGFGWAARELAVLAARRWRGAGSRVPASSGGSGSGSGRTALGAASQWAATALLALVFLFVPSWVGSSMISIPRTHGSLVYQAHLRQGMNDLVARFGGADKVLACGSVASRCRWSPGRSACPRRASRLRRPMGAPPTRSRPARPPTSSCRPATRARPICCPS